MVIAKGFQKEFGAKVDALVMNPRLVCHRKASIYDIVGYVVYDGEKAIASAKSAQEAWWKAFKRLQLEVKSKKSKGRKARR